MLLNALAQWSPLTTMFAQQCPLYVVWLTGIVIALVKWRKHPRLSLLVLLTLVCFLILFVLEGLAFLFGPLVARDNHWDYSQMTTFYIGISLVYSLLIAILWGFTLWALFGKAIRS